MNIVLKLGQTGGKDVQGLQLLAHFPILVFNFQICFQCKCMCRVMCMFIYAHYPLLYNAALYRVMERNELQFMVSSPACLQSQELDAKWIQKEGLKTVLGIKDALKLD